MRDEVMKDEVTGRYGHSMGSIMSDEDVLINGLGTFLLFLPFLLLLT